MNWLQLQPVSDPESDFDSIAQAIKKLLRDELYFPLLKELGVGKKVLLKNSLDELFAALQAGTIVFSHGRFTGKFNANISKALREIGAQWDRSAKNYRILYSKLPIDVKMAISVSEARFESKFKSLDQKIAQILPEQIADKLKVSHLFDRALYKVDAEQRKSLKSILITPKITEEQRAKIADEYTNNLKLKIKEFTEKQTQKLREDIRKNVFAGYRYESLIASIEKNYKVSSKKAKFLARQETNLLLTKFKEARYTSCGVNEYKWRCVTGSPLHPVRPMHQELNDRSKKGEVFRFDDPPVDDPNGGRHNPGEAYNCRCIAIPVVRYTKK